VLDVTVTEVRLQRPCIVARDPQRGTGWLDVAAWGRPRERVTTDLPNAARAISRAHLRAGSRLLLRVRPARLSLRLACRAVGQRR
jgi:hypothetical protein